MNPDDIADSWEISLKDTSLSVEKDTVSLMTYIGKME